MINIAIFASGSGTNAQRIAEYFAPNKEVSITRIFCNKPDAYVLQRAQKLKIPTMIFDRKDFYHSGKVLQQLKEDASDFIVLAGFLWLIPSIILTSFKERVINIHPALLPKYGGKGMYGHHVHQAVMASGDKESGITIHYVNENYDEGNVIFQAKCKIENGDTTESLAAKIHELEYKHFPIIIERIIQSIPKKG